MIKMIEQNGETVYNVVSYMLDSVEDIEKLPKGIASGSTALIPLTTGLEVYILNNQKEWVKL